MILQINGQVEMVLPPQSGTTTTGEQWTKCDFIVVDNPKDKYPNRIWLTAFNERIIDIPQVGSKGVFQYSFIAREAASGVFLSVIFCRFIPAQPDPLSQDTSPQDDHYPLDL